ncbi:MAG TPA: hypothetical protein VE545_06480, partial [Candidatus Dormibacteraeota bacterium]|nr:hypothetical protein [Candidatus Dormibacteraeota bacterium]
MPAENEEKHVNGEVREGQNVDKIRDILFGSQMRDYEKRFVRLEERVTKASEALRDDMKKRVDALESFVQQEMEALGQRVNKEKAERAEALKELTREARDNAKGLEHKLSGLEEQLAGAQGDLRAKILDQSKSLGAEIRK